MSQLMDYVRYQVKEIGPRPAGTEEEQQTALYITEQFQKEAGFTAGIEEFPRATRPDLSQAILGAAMAVITILAMFVSVTVIPAFIIAALLAAVFILEIMGTPLLSRVLAKGASQNVVAKYQPNPEVEGASRSVSRKLILVAHYDSGRVTPALLKRLDQGKFPLELLAAGAMAVEAFLLFLRIFIAISGGGALVLLNVLSVLVLLVCLLPAVKLLLMRNAPLNEGANNNATGVAALIEVARRISRGSVSEADLEEFVDEVAIHGIDAALKSGLVPEGATIDYEALRNIAGTAREEDVVEGTEEERLLAAKEAIAAMTGKPVERRIYSTLSEPEEVVDNTVEFHQEMVDIPPEEAPAPGGEFTQIPDEEFAQAFKAYRTGSIPPVSADGPQSQAAAPADPVPAPAPAPAANSAQAVAAATAFVPAEQREQGQDAGGFQNAPSWFVAAQKNAKKPSGSGEVHRSRFTEAIENAQHEREEQERARVQAEEEARQAEARAALEAQEKARAEAEAEAARAAQATQAEAVDETAQARARLSESTQAMSAADLKAASLSGEGAQAVAAEVVELQAETRETQRGSMPRYADDATSARIGSREAAVPAQLVSEETVKEPPAPVEDGLDTPLSRVAGLPHSAGNQPEGDQAPVSRQDRLRNLRTMVPSLSGVIRSKDEVRKSVVKTVPDVRNVPTPMEGAAPSGRASAAATGGSDGVNTPTYMPPSADYSSAAPADGSGVDYDMVVPSDFNPQLETTDFADTLMPDGEGYREIDQVDAGFAEYDEYDSFEEVEEGAADQGGQGRGGFFSRFRHKRQDEAMESPQEWLGVDDDFDARSVGRARGGWESFRDDQYGEDDPFSDDTYDTFGDFASDERSPRHRRWEGGAASRRSLGHVSTRSGEDSDAAIPDAPPEADQDRFITGEIERIYHFRNPAFNTEIWFVAMGCNDSHDGARAFLEEHKGEMRGSMVIEVESLGAGALSVASREGAVKKISASSRIKRYTREAVNATGIKLDEVDMSGTESIASIVQKAGFQSMHLFGAEDGRPALKGSADDVMENVDEMLLDEYTSFVMELLKR